MTNLVKIFLIFRFISKTSSEKSFLGNDKFIRTIAFIMRSVDFSKVAGFSLQFMRT